MRVTAVRVRISSKGPSIFLLRSRGQTGIVTSFRPTSCEFESHREHQLLRGLSSAGRAFAWHAKGRRFDPARLHQFPMGE